MTKKHIFRRLQIKVRPKGLHKSLTPDPWPLTPALSTTVEDSLQISPVFMQNEPNFPVDQMNLNKVITKDYEEKTLGEHGKNEPKTNPNEPNFKKAKMNVTSALTKAYENKTPIRAPKKRTQFSLTTKTNANLFTKRDYEKYRVFGSRQNKPNQSQFLYHWFWFIFDNCF